MSGQFDQGVGDSDDIGPFGSEEPTQEDPSGAPAESQDATAVDAIADVDEVDPVGVAADIQVEDSIVVVAVTDEDQTEQMSEDDLQGLAEANRQELDQTLADLQQELAGMAKTGIPGVDAALDQLGGLDPNDLQGSTQVLAEVLAKLEAVMSEAPKE